jgi:hypothetical protein
MDGKYSSRFEDRVHWKLTFAWWPQICELSEKNLWLCLAYKGTAMWTGPGEDIVEVRWRDKNEHLIYELKGRK